MVLQIFSELVHFAVKFKAKKSGMPAYQIITYKAPQSAGPFLNYFRNIYNN